MHGTRRLTDEELAELQRRRPGARASLACEGMYLTAEDEALFDEMDRDRLVPEDRIIRIKEMMLAQVRCKTFAAE